MSNNAQENVQMNDQLTKSLLAVNKLLYKMPPAIGITQRRNRRIDYFQQNNYIDGETMVLDSQLGSDFCDPKNSYLRFIVAPNANGGFNSGSAANVINRAVIRSRQGKELTRMENCNLLVKYAQVYDCPQDWKNTIGKAQGYGSDTADDVTPVTGKLYVIPMWVFACFNVDCLLPSQYMEGLRIELTLESPDVAFGGTSAGAGAVSNYAVSRPEIHWDSYDLADQYKRKIAEMATQGLNIIHKEYFHTIVASSSSGQTDFNFDIKKSASKALKLMIVSRDQSLIGDNNEDSLASAQYDYIRSQSHIGQIYYPNQPLSVDDITEDGNAEAYVYTLSCFDKLSQCWYPSSVTPEQFTAAPATAQKNSVVAFSFNKSNVSDLQGMQVNNSRAVIVDLKSEQPGTGGAPAAYSRRLDCYLQHLRAIKVYTSNIEVRD